MSISTQFQNVVNMLDELLEKAAERGARKALAEQEASNGGRPVADDRYVDTSAICKILGRGRTTVNGFIDEGMPFIWVGKRRQFRPSECIAWLEARSERIEREQQQATDEVSAVFANDPDLAGVKVLSKL